MSRTGKEGLNKRMPKKKDKKKGTDIKVTAEDALRDERMELIGYFLLWADLGVGKPGD